MHALIGTGLRFKMVKVVVRQSDERLIFTKILSEKVFPM